MINIEMKLSEESINNLIKELDHIGILMSQGWREGRGWKIAGSEEKIIDAETNKEVEEDLPVIE